MIRALILSGFLLLSSRAEAFDPSVIDAASMERMVGGGQVVLVEEYPDGRLKLVTGGTLVKAPPQKVWDLISDYETYSDWMPQTTEVTVSNRTEKRADAHFVLDFQFSVISKTVEYTTRHTFEPPHAIRWTLVEGDFNTSVGAWHLVPAKGGTSTLVFYSTFTDLTSMGWIVRALLEEQPTMEVAIQGSTALMVVKSVKEKLE